MAHLLGASRGSLRGRCGTRMTARAYQTLALAPPSRPLVGGARRACVGDGVWSVKQRRV